MANAGLLFTVLLFPTVALAGGPFALVGAGIATVRRQRLTRAKPVLIRDVRQGQTAVVVGTITRVREPLLAPISQRPCVAISVASAGKRSMRDTFVADFEIEDASGRALVHGAGAQAFLCAAESRTRTFGPYDDVGEWLGSWPGSFHRPVTITERLLLPGARVAVRGCADWRPEVSAAQYRSAALRLHLGGSPRSRMLVADLR